jgi:oleate hydratase
MDLIDKIPTIKKNKTLKEKFLKFNEKNKVYFKGRLIKDKKIIEAKSLKMNIKDRLKLVKLLFTRENKIENIKIREFFSPNFFKSNFWYEFCTVFAFIP